MIFFKDAKLLQMDDEFFCYPRGTCCEWSQRFKNGDFDVEDRHSGGREKVFEDAELEALT